MDIETVPLDKGGYLAKPEADRKKLLNPIDSRIIAIGVKVSGGKAEIFHSGSEKEMLSSFWAEVEGFVKKGPLGNKIVGFNIKSFDLPFLVTRSFINDVAIVPFVVKDVVDLRDQLSAFKYGHTRGKLKEYAELMGIPLVEGIDGERVAEEYYAGNIKKILKYLEKDIEITEAVHERIVKLKIDKIARW